MEPRKVLVITSENQKRYELTSTANTVGELKQELINAGINIENKALMEGISKTPFIMNDTQLPSSVTFKGSPTRNLMLLVTESNKNIASGCYPTNRKQFNEYIKKNNLGDAINKKLGNHWTRISTDKLTAFFKSYESKNNKTKAELKNVREEVAGISKQIQVETKTIDIAHPLTVELICNGIKHLVKEEVLYTEDVVAINDFIGSFTKELIKNKPIITEDDINEIMSTL